MRIDTLKGEFEIGGKPAGPKVKIWEFVGGFPYMLVDLGDEFREYYDDSTEHFKRARKEGIGKCGVILILRRRGEAPVAYRTRSRDLLHAFTNKMTKFVMYVKSLKTDKHTWHVPKIEGYEPPGMFDIMVQGIQSDATKRSIRRRPL